MSSTEALCVSRPVEIKSTPVAVIAGADFSVTHPKLP
jgi:hypothetical protein